ncbi:MAG TPA: oligosaccharide flippase family protein [Thermoanaerobaculia bacterium]|nr:oligosaccharide flippase family protein [Thermoanaerobaculia bacterium]
MLTVGTGLLARLVPARLRDESVVAVLSRGSAGSVMVSGVGALVGVASHMLLARLLGVEAFGRYSYAWTVASLLVIVATLGFDTAQVRFVASYRVSGEWGRLAGLLRFGDRLVLAAGVAVGGLTAGVVALFSPELSPALAHTLWAACAALPVLAVLGLKGAALQGLKRVVWARLPEGVIRPPLALALAALAAWALGGIGSAGTMLATLAAAAVCVWVGQILLARSLPSEVDSATPESHGREWVRVSLPLLLVSGMRLMMGQADVLLVGAMLGTREAGLYTAATRLGQLITFGQNAANGIAAPLISELHAQGDRQGLQRAVTLASWGATLWAAAAALVLAVLGRWLLGLWGPEFSSVWSVLVILSLGQVVNAAAGPVGYLLNMTGHQDTNARILGWVVGANILLNVPAIAWLGAPGAALTTAVLNAVKNVWTWVEVRRRLGIAPSVLFEKGVWR